MTIASSSGLSDKDIERMVSDAEQYAERLVAEARAKQSAEEKAEADHRAALDSAGTLPDQPCRRPARFCPRL